MREPVAQWMRSQGLTIRAEFISPWGICDLVGLCFNEHNVARRNHLKQNRAVTSMVRAALLLKIPDIESNEAITINQLIKECSPSLIPERVTAEAERLVKDGFVLRRKRNSLQKINGWTPLQKRFIAIELKLKRVAEAILQAENNFGFADESYIALPDDLATRLAAKLARRETFKASGVGLLGVTSNSCKLLIPSHRQNIEKDAVVQFYCVEKFWSVCAKDN